MDNFSFFSIMRHALSGHKKWQKTWASRSLKKEYDVILIGGGGQGLATAYYLAKNHGINKIAILEKGWIGGGNTGRNTTAIRSNYFYKESTDFFEHSMKLYEKLGNELNYNIMFSQRGILSLAHSEYEMEMVRRWANAIQINGVDSEFLNLSQIKEMVPFIDESSEARYPIVGGFIQRRGGVARHDAVAWGYARAASHLGVDIIQNCEVSGIDIKNGHVQGVETNQGYVVASKVAVAVAGHTSILADMAKVKVPIRSMALQAMVTEPLKPFFNTVVQSSACHVYCSQSDRGELVMGGAADVYSSYAQRGNIPAVEDTVSALLELYPSLSRLKLMRQWAGIVDISPDSSPIISKTSVKGFYLNGGWGTGGFKAIPAGGETYAHLIAKDEPHHLIEPFSLDRFYTGALVDESAAAGVSH